MAQPQLSPEAFLIVNPRSGSNTPREGLAMELLKLATSIAPHKIRGFAPESLDELRLVVREILRQKPKYILFAGGDGTMSTVMTFIMRELERVPGIALPMFGIIATGTMNLFATALGLADDPAEVTLNRIANMVKHGMPFEDVVRNPLLRVVGDGGEAEYACLLGDGLPVNLLEKVYESPIRGQQGVSRVFWEATMKELMSAFTFQKSPAVLTSPVYASVTFPEGTNPPAAPMYRHTALLAGTVDKVGLGFHALHDARSEEGTFMVRITNEEYWDLVRNIVHLYNGIPSASFFDINVPKMSINCLAKTKFTIDGELREWSKVDVGITRPLTFVRG